MQLGKASSLLANVFLLQRFFWNVVADCPYVNKVGPTIQEANELAVPRLAQYEEDFPAEDVGRTYNVGVENPNEVFCDGSEENKFCDKVWKFELMLCFAVCRFESNSECNLQMYKDARRMG